MDKILKMHKAGLQPLAILQRLTCTPGICVNDLHSFVDTCRKLNWALHEQTARVFISTFELHKHATENIRKDVYSKMQRSGVDVDAIAQKARMEGFLFNPLAQTGGSDEKR